MRCSSRRNRHGRWVGWLALELAGVSRVYGRRDDAHAVKLSRITAARRIGFPIGQQTVDQLPDAGGNLRAPKQHSWILQQ